MSWQPVDRDARILIIDDEAANVRLLELMLGKAGYAELRCVTDPRQALFVYLNFQPDLVLLDLQMPFMDGFTVMTQVRTRTAGASFVPILVLTADASSETKLRALSAGASDFASKPFDATEVMLRIANLLEMRRLHRRLAEQNEELEVRVAERTIQLEEKQIETLERLAVMAEYRDDATGRHTRRVAALAARLAGKLGLPAETVELIMRAAPLHDAGKISVPDSVLLKPGRLTPQEFDIVKTHTVVGAKILAGSSHPLLQMAEEIALTHHELSGRRDQVLEAFREPLPDPEREADYQAVAGRAGEEAVAVYLAALPDDHPDAGTSLQNPRSPATRFDVQKFSWLGGTNAVDVPRVRVVDEAGNTVDTNDYGDIVTTVEFPTLGDTAAWVAEGRPYTWTAHWETNADSPTGEFRFEVDGVKRAGNQPVLYQLTSMPFALSAWTAGAPVTLGTRQTVGSEEIYPLNIATTSYPQTYSAADQSDPRKPVYIDASSPYEKTFRPRPATWTVANVVGDGSTTAEFVAGQWRVRVPIGVVPTRTSTWTSAAPASLTAPCVCSASASNKTSMRSWSGSPPRASATATSA